jgi:putative addiction module component (TIGR02574 family)
MILEAIPQVQALTKAEKLLLANEIWREQADEPSELPLTREHIAELDSRMAHYRAHPEEVTTWEQIKARLKLGKSSA